MGIKVIVFNVKVTLLASVIEEKTEFCNMIVDSRLKEANPQAAVF